MTEQDKENIRIMAGVFLEQLGSMDDEATFIDGVNFALDKVSPFEAPVMLKIADEAKLEVLKEIKKEVAEKQQKLYRSRIPYVKDDCWEIVEDIDSQIKLLEGVIKGISYKIDKLEEQ